MQTTGLEPVQRFPPGTCYPSKLKREWLVSTRDLFTFILPTMGPLNIRSYHLLRLVANRPDPNLVQLGITAFPEVKGMSDNREKQEKTVVTRSGVSIYRKRN
jgi:hypothetical protein